MFILALALPYSPNTRHNPATAPTRPPTITNSRQLAMLGPMRPQPTKIWRRKFVKVMVVGDSGLGKTTLISALLSKPGEQLQVREGEQEGRQCTAPTVCCSTKRQHSVLACW